MGKIIRPHTNFCRKCQGVREHIISKNNALKDCYNNNPLRNELIDDPDIKDFIKKCPEVSKCIQNDPSRAKKTVLPKGPNLQPCKKNNTCTTGTVSTEVTDDPDIKDFIKKCPEVSKCIQNDPSRAKKTVLPKGPNLQPCKKNNTCTTGTVSTEVTGKPKPQLETTSSGIIIPERQKQSEQNQKPDSAVELKYTEISAGTEPDKISPADTAGASHKPSVPEDIQRSNKPGQGETSAQSSQTFPHSTTVELDTLSSTPLQSTSILESQSSNHSPILDLAKDTPKSDSYEQQDVDGSSNREQDESHKIVQSQDPEDTVTVKENIAIIDNRTDDGRDAHVTVSVDKSAGDNSLGSEVSDAHNSVNALLCNETSCTKEKDSQLVTDNGNILATLSYISNVIQDNKENVIVLLENQGHMINTSIPIGIVLLLTLLFKYTPLWSFLTKRKRKKQSHMNEKLQRVLQQPSIESEERSVPFSYSAFEYSS
ncbi:PIR protein [Plasmodium vivax]|uniref:VIR protein n=1 Tax=Plasmodium vivax TaxID=5855 RepID=A0A565A5M4_PLAVI|nr:PIR protein [Plasmodium vivax]